MTKQIETASRDISFASHGDCCVGTLYRPSSADSSQKLPVIIMAHGFCAQRDFQLPAFAERFAAEGFACFVFDYRNFGDSSGTPRHWVNPRRHQQDWRKALAFVRSLPDIDADRVILWGTSYSGGHVLQIASERPKILAAIAQVPFVSGLDLLKTSSIGFSLQLTAAGLRDIAGSLFGHPHYIPAVGHPGELAAMNTPECWDGWHAIMPEGTMWENKVLARAFLTLPYFNPLFVVEKIAVPALVIAGMHDTITPWHLAKKAAGKIPKGVFKSLDTNHFGPYTGQYFEQNIAAQIEFLKYILAR